MVTQRRGFRAKPGSAATLFDRLREVLPSLDVRPGQAARAYAGLLRGHTDRVVLELDVDDAGHLLAEGLRLAAGREAERYEAYRAGEPGIADRRRDGRTLAR
jgi:hypothetical protein